MANKLLKFRRRLAKAIISLAYEVDEDLSPYISNILNQIEGNEIALYGINASKAKIKREILTAAKILKQADDS